MAPFPKAAMSGGADHLLRYVVLRHDGIDDPHFDLMLEREDGAALRTWRCPVWPIDQMVILHPLPDHRREYLHFEGAISGGRGVVTQVETGLYQLIPDAKVRDESDLILYPSIPGERSPLQRSGRFSGRTPTANASDSPRPHPLRLIHLGTSSEWRARPAYCG